MSDVRTTIVVTGGAGGIGSAVVDRLLRDGHRVAIVDHVDPVLPSDDDVLRLRCDVSSADETADAFERIVQWSPGRIVGLAAVAGQVERESGYALTTKSWESVLGTHVTGSMNWAVAVGRHLRENGGGSIVTIGSICGTRGFPEMTAYSVAKAAIHQLTRSLAVEWAVDGIRVNCVAPGYIETSAMRDSSGKSGVASTVGSLHALGRTGEPAEIASAVAFLISQESSFITGEVLFVDGGFSVMARPRGFGSD